MVERINGRTLFYGKGDVLTYRTYAKPLQVAAIQESSYTGDDNIIFAHNVKFAVSGASFLISFTEGDNSQVVATDSMKNFILKQTATFDGSTTEGLLAHLSRQFLARYSHVEEIQISADRIPFDPLSESQLVFRRSHNDHASASLTVKRTAEGAVIQAHACQLSDLQLIKVSGSSFYGFIRDEYTTLPESYDRPLFIYLNIGWRYSELEDALDSERGGYVASDQLRDIAHTVFHELNTPSIQYLIYQIGLRVLRCYPQLAEVYFESNNRTWETVIERCDSGEGSVYTEPRPPFGFQGFSMTRADLNQEG